MITCKRLSQCTLQDALIAWNKGFEGYDFDMTLTLEAFLNRLVFENLSPALSIVAFDGTDEVTIQIEMNGEDTRKLEKSGHYDLVMSNPGTIDERAVRLFKGPVNVVRLITAEEEALT